MTTHSVSDFLATHGSHVCSCWPCPQPGMHHIPNGLWPTTERLSTANLNQKALDKRGLQRPAPRRRNWSEHLKQFHAATLAQHRHKAAEAVRQKNANRVALIIAEFDGTHEGIERLAEKYEYKYVNMRRLLREAGCGMPGGRGVRRKEA